MQLVGKLFIRGQIHVKTGLKIGGSKSDVPIGGIENSVIVTSEGVPFIPGSSLKGKMRCLLERAKNHNLELCKCGSKGCKICTIFGVEARNEKSETGPTRLTVRDAFLSAETKKAMANREQPFQYLELNYTESKWENVIDRRTSRATNPRQTERVPAGAKFDFSMVYNLFSDEDIDNVAWLISGLGLLEDDYLGGNGSRGYGQICFENIAIVLKTIQTYTTSQEPIPICKEKNLEGINIEDVIRKIKSEQLFSGSK